MASAKDREKEFREHWAALETRFFMPLFERVRHGRIRLDSAADDLTEEMRERIVAVSHISYGELLQIRAQRMHEALIEELCAHLQSLEGGQVVFLRLEYYEEAHNFMLSDLQEAGLYSLSRNFTKAFNDAMWRENTTILVHPVFETIERSLLDTLVDTKLAIRIARKLQTHNKGYEQSFLVPMQDLICDRFRILLRSRVHNHPPREFLIVARVWVLKWKGSFRIVGGPKGTHGLEEKLCEEVCSAYEGGVQIGVFPTARRLWDERDLDLLIRLHGFYKQSRVRFPFWCDSMQRSMVSKGKKNIKKFELGNSCDSMGNIYETLPHSIQAILDTARDFWSLLERCDLERSGLGARFFDGVTVLVNSLSGEHPVEELLSGYLKWLLKSNKTYNLAHRKSLFGNVGLVFNHLPNKKLFIKKVEQQLSELVSGGQEDHIQCYREILNATNSHFPHAWDTFEEMLCDLEAGITVRNQLKNLGCLAVPCQSEVAVRNQRVFLSGGNTQTIDIGVLLLRKNLWPQKEANNLQSIIEVEACDDMFLGHLRGKLSGKKVSISHDLGRVTIQSAMFARTGSVDIVLSVSQATVLMLFNDRDCLRFEEICQAILPWDTGKAREKQVSKEAVISVLRSLMAPYPLLQNRGGRRESQGNELFALNPDFATSAPILELPSQVHDADNETECASKKDWNVVLDVAIVKLLKGKKVSTHEALVTALHERFGSEIDGIKERIKSRIENLIDREYMKRLDEDPSIYIYI